MDLLKLLTGKKRQKVTKALSLLKRKKTPAPPAAVLDKYLVDIVDAIADNLSLEDFRNLRLVNKAINVATILLFTRKYLHYLEVDFTQGGLQKAIDITSHYDVSGSICFGSRIDTIAFDFEHFVWTSNEEDIWLSGLRYTNDPIHRRTMKKEARKAAKQWCSHREMLAQGLYSTMLTTIFQQVERVAVEIIDEREDDFYNTVARVLVQERGRWRRSVIVGYQPSAGNISNCFPSFNTATWCLQFSAPRTA